MRDVKVKKGYWLERIICFFRGHVFGLNEFEKDKSKEYNCSCLLCETEFKL